MDKLKKITSNLSFRLVLMIVAILFGGDFIPLTAKEISYGFSLTLKNILLFLMPFIIFSCLFSCMLSFKNNALKFMALLFAGVAVSNFFWIWVTYAIAAPVVPYLTVSLSTISADAPLEPFWVLDLGSLVPNQVSIFLGLLVGSFFSIYRMDAVNRFASRLNQVVMLFMKKIFTPLLPMFVAGFMIQMQHEGVLEVLVKSYFSIFVFIIGLSLSYLILFYLAAAGFSKQRFLKYIRDFAPAGLTGFGAMSSMAALPLNILAAEKNTNPPSRGKALITATVNIHLLGDTPIVCISVFTILLAFGEPLPTVASFFAFSLAYAGIKFAGAGVPAGSVILTVPILEQYLGLTSEMTAIITAIYILFDPLATATNVMGNGAFSILLSRLSRFKKDADNASDEAQVEVATQKFGT